MWSNLRTVPPPAQQYLSVTTRGLRGLGGPGLATTALAGLVSRGAFDGLGDTAFDTLSPAWRTGIWIAGTAGFAASVYHGYKRNGGRFWPTLGWGIFGAFLPIISVPVALAQGFGKRKGR